MGKKPSQKWASSQRKLGKALGKSHTAVAKWTKHQDWPFGNKPNPKWLPGDVRRWVAENLSRDPADRGRTSKDITEMQRLQMEKLEAEIAAKNRKAAHEELLFVARAQVDLDNVQKIQAVKSALDNLGRVIESRLTGISRRQRKRARELIEEQVEEILRSFSNGHRHD